MAGLAPGLQFADGGEPTFTPTGPSSLWATNGRAHRAAEREMMWTIEGASLLE
jgi:hypothetical protein